MIRRTVLLSLALVSALTGCLNDRVELQGAGASFPAPIYARWCALFHRAYPHISVHYRAIGSGRGIQQITAHELDFGASDALLKADELRALPAPLQALPTVLGPVVLAYNLPDLEGELTLSGETIAAIYLGKITAWDDPAIAAVNPGRELPALPIRVAHRTDSSGTTNIFTDYLSAVSRRWREQVGVGKTVAWPTGDDWAGDGNDGVAHRILLERGGIGYVELKYAQNAGLRYAALINRAGQRVWPSVASVQAAERNTAPVDESGGKPSIVNAPGEQSYPIAGFTYLLVYQDLSDMEPTKAQALQCFLEWILVEGQTVTSELHYTPLPESLRLATLQRVQNLKLPQLPRSATSRFPPTVRCDFPR